jgi:lactoylglutathione lyase
MTSLFETHLTVADLDRSTAFYRGVVGLTLAHAVPERGAAFFWTGAAGESMLGLWTPRPDIGIVPWSSRR